MSPFGVGAGGGGEGGSLWLQPKLSKEKIGEVTALYALKNTCIFYL